MAQAKEIALRRATVAEVLPLIELAAAFNTDDGEFDAARVALCGDRFVFEEGGRPVCGFVLETRGDEVYVMAAGSVGRHDFTLIGLGAIEGMARDHFRSVAFATKRGGLIRKARRLGYVVDGAEIDGSILRKKL